MAKKEEKIRDLRARITIQQRNLNIFSNIVPKQRRCLFPIILATGEQYPIPASTDNGLVSRKCSDVSNSNFTGHLL
ncbi:hypothetical protein LguiB_000661 [Lonicera macranthoides]